MISILFNKKILLLIVVVGLVLAICAYFLFIRLNPPIKVAGLSEYDNERKKVDIELINNGNRPLQIVDVLINGKHAEDVKLILSYTLQLPLSGIDEDRYARFVELDEHPINPAFSAKQLKQLQFPHTEPIFFGLRIHSEQHIEHIKIKYKYKGLTFVKQFAWERWFE